MKSSAKNHLYSPKAFCSHLKTSERYTVRSLTLQHRSCLILLSVSDWKKQRQANCGFWKTYQEDEANFSEIKDTSIDFL